MARKNALLRLVDTLRARRTGQHKKLAGEMASLRDFRTGDSSGDSADLAFEADSDEIASRLVELDDRELTQIERALARWERGTFGDCECCHKRIPLDRLNALPHTPFCIGCVRALENHPDARARRNTGNWDQVADAQASMQDQKVDLAEMETQAAGDR